MTRKQPAWHPDTPPSWPVRRADEVFEIVSGSTPKTKVSEYWGGPITWVTPDDMQQGALDVLHSGRRSITQEGYDSCSTKLVPAGSILLSSRAPIGYVAVAGSELCTNQGFKTFAPKDGTQVDPRFVMWWLRAVRSKVEMLGSGTTFKELSKGAASTIPIPVPPLAEQHEIVEAIERLMSHLDRGASTLTLLRSRIETFRAAGMRDATRFDEDVPREPLGELSEVIAGPAFKSKEFVDAGSGVRLLRGANVAPGRLKWDAKVTKAWPESKRSEFDRFELSVGDIILAMDRPVISTGLKLARVAESDLPALLVQRVARIRPHDPALGDWILSCLRSPRFIPHLMSDVTGTQLPHITLEGIRTYEIPLPSAERRATRQQQAERIATYTDHADNLVVAQQERGHALRRAILKAALEGRLTQGGPNAISVDEHEESVA